MKVIQETGRWWIPGHDDNALHGTFNYETGSQLKLTTYGDFSREPTDTRHYDEIWGVTSSGQCIVLQDCQRLSFQWTQGGQTEIWNVELAFSSQSEDIFNHHRPSTLWIQLSNLNNWTGRSIFQVDPIQDLETRKTTGTRITIEEYPPIKLSTCQDWTWSILTIYDRIPVQSHDELQSILINQVTQLQIDFEEPIDFATSHPSIHLFRSFLSLAAQRSVHTTSIIGENEQVRHFDIYNDRIISYDRESETRQHAMLFLRQDVPDIQTALNDWHRKAENLGTIYDLYMSPLLIPEATIETKFLWAIQACDSYIYYQHRKSKRRGKVNIETGICDLLRQYGHIVKIQEEEVKAHANRIARARHYYSHRDQTQRDLVARGQDLIQITKLIRTILEIVLMDEIGFPLTTIEGIIDRRNRRT